MEMYLSVEGVKDSEFRFPVLPPSFERQLAFNNQQIDVNQIGTVNLIGKPGLQTVQIDAFFPEEFNSSFVQVGEDELRNPYEYVDRIESMKGKICRFKLFGGDRETANGVAANGVNMLVLIDSFNYSEKDGTRDVYFSLGLSEYKVLETTRVSVPKTKKKTYTTKAKDTCKKVAKKKLGSASKGKIVYNNNIKACDKAFKNKKYAEKNKKKAKVNKMMPKGVKLTLPK